MRWSNSRADEPVPSGAAYLAEHLFRHMVPFSQHIHRDRPYEVNEFFPRNRPWDIHASLATHVAHAISPLPHRRQNASYELNFTFPQSLYGLIGLAKATALSRA